MDEVLDLRGGTSMDGVMSKEMDGKVGRKKEDVKGGTGKWSAVRAGGIWAREWVAEYG